MLYGKTLLFFDFSNLSGFLCNKFWEWFYVILLKNHGGIFEKNRNYNNLLVNYRMCI